MIPPDAQTIKALAHVAQNVPAVGGWLKKWSTTELKRLPIAVNNTAVAQGRCQVLEEISDLFEKAPALAAELNAKQPRAEPRIPIGA
jgi:hypothetical protein|tara:strand:- start:675 stop:935 length:261 start_codon:yes stop_codon:yes gene_type:complete